MINTTNNNTNTTANVFNFVYDNCNTNFLLGDRDIYWREISQGNEEYDDVVIMQLTDGLKQLIKRAIYDKCANGEIQQYYLADSADSDKSDTVCFWNGEEYDINDDDCPEYVTVDDPEYVYITEIDDSNMGYIAGTLYQGDDKHFYVTFESRYFGYGGGYTFDSYSFDLRLGDIFKVSAVAPALFLLEANFEDAVDDFCDWLDDSGVCPLEEVDNCEEEGCNCTPDTPADTAEVNGTTIPNRDLVLEHINNLARVMSDDLQQLDNIYNAYKLALDRFKHDMAEFNEFKTCIEHPVLGGYAEGLLHDIVTRLNRSNLPGIDEGV